LFASYKIFVGLLSPSSSDYQGVALEPFLIPPKPPVNPFIKPRNPPPSSKTSVEAYGSEKRPGIKTDTPVCSKKLIRPLLLARVEAMAALSRYMTELKNSRDGEIFLQFLRKKGAVLNGVGI
jgi:glycerol-3-phosphate O-acyltransferase/dihydroxyacetone phosphate acyltransferase